MGTYSDDDRRVSLEKLSRDVGDALDQQPSVIPHVDQPVAYEYSTAEDAANEYPTAAYTTVGYSAQEYSADEYPDAGYGTIQYTESDYTDTEYATNGNAAAAYPPAPAPAGRSTGSVIAIAASVVAALAIGSLAVLAFTRASEPPPAPVTVTATTVVEKTLTTTPPTETTTVTIVAVTPMGSCAPIGKKARFADGSRAYCARLQYTDGGVWFTSPGVAPNPAGDPTTTTSAPEVYSGMPCTEDQSGTYRTTPGGTAYRCDGESWEFWEQN
jgi:hypothetical protein